MHANGPGWGREKKKNSASSAERRDDFELFTRMQGNSGLNFSILFRFAESYELGFLSFFFFRFLVSRKDEETGKINWM